MKGRSIFHFFRRNDIPNWIAILLTTIIIPLILLFWNNRTYSHIPGLEITFKLGRGQVDGESCPYLDIIFFNRTGKVVFLTDVKLVDFNSDNITIHEKASLDIVSHSFVLKFVDEHTNQFLNSYVILQTNDSAVTGLPIPINYNGNKGKDLMNNLNSYKGRSGGTKFFNLEYIALVGDKKYKVKFKY